MSAPEKPQTTETPSPEETRGFGLAVEQLVRLRNQGDVLLFLTSNFTVRIIGEAERYHPVLTKELESAGIKEFSAETLIRDVRTVLQFCLYAQGPAAAVSMLGQEYYGYRPKRQPQDDPKQAERFRELVEHKVDQVSDRLINPLLRDRANRLRGTTGAIFYDVDMDVVTERNNSSTESEVRVPFLRLRLRYTEENASFSSPYFPVFLLGDSQRQKSFELECDESDIKLMILRLESARDSLSRALNAASQSSLPPSRT